MIPNLKCGLIQETNRTLFVGTSTHLHKYDLYDSLLNPRLSIILRLIHPSTNMIQIDNETLLVGE